MDNFDLGKTAQLAELFATPRDGRDDAWQQRFYAAVPQASLASFEQQVAYGPDTFPYFQLAMPEPGPLTPFSIAHVLDFVLANGLGIVIFGNTARTEDPEWVFTYGNLLSFKLFSSFEGDPASVRDALPEPGSQVLVGAPNESILPAPARAVLGEFMREKYQHPSPRVALVTRPGVAPVLMFNLKLSDYDGDQKKLDAALYYLRWFLPGTYGSMALPAGWDENSGAPLE